MPLKFQEILNNLKKAMSKRGISLTPLTDEEKNRLGKLIDNLGIGGWGDSSKQ